MYQLLMYCKLKQTARCFPLTAALLSMQGCNASGDSGSGGLC